MHQANCKINLMGTWFLEHVINNSIGVTIFSKSDTTLYISIITLPTQYNAKLLQQSKSCCKRTMNRNKDQSKVPTQNQNYYLDYMSDPSFFANVRG